MNTLAIAARAFGDLMKIGRKRSLIGPPEVRQMTTEYLDGNGGGLQIDWIANKLGLEPTKLQSECCEEADWTVWPASLFEISAGHLKAPVVAELAHHGMIPILAEQGRTNGKDRNGYLLVLAEHPLVAPLALAICRRHNLNYLFCFPAVVDIAELQTLLAATT